ncbi:MAG: DegT/DnrJ/EryC1/StrS family aminotransferase [Nitrospirae bacterium]|nr:DegT/DnrJ/EryC1/StrS family aminotransferase [Nitrospirota bacterium]
MNVPFVDLKAQTESIRPEIDEAVKRTLDRCDFILGGAVSELEKNFASFSGCSEAVGVSSGLEALILALRAVGVSAGDEVILPANTFIATAFAVSATGAMPVLVDCDENYNIDASAVESKITPRTKALLPVHLTGHPCDIEKVLEVAKRRKLFVIEDAAQAHGAEYKGKRCGSFGDIGCFSFYPGKNLGAFGDGGIITANDSALAEKIRCLRNYGQKVKYEHIYIGSNNRLDTIQAAILNVKLKYLDGWNDKRIKNAALYGELLKDVKNVRTPSVLPGCRNIFHLYIIECDRRDGLQKFLDGKGVQNGIHYPIPVHLQKCYESLGYREGDFPVSERLAKRILSLPMFPELTAEQIRYVASCVKEFYSS